MRLRSMLGAAVVAGGLVAAPAVDDDPAAAPATASKLPSAVLRQLGFDRVALSLLPKQTDRGTRLVPVQFDCNPGELGERICINGWVWTCECFSYGCRYMTGAVRCRRNEPPC